MLTSEIHAADTGATAAPDTAADSSYTATYSPEDNKLRLYSLHRLDKELYQRVRDAGFIFAPKQDLFVAPMWTPSRHDLLLELCGEIEAEEMTLAERAAERAERFSDYNASRTSDAQSARAAVDAIAGNIPFGQPILVGHHSERRARKDAERIENSMRRAVSMWDTAEYWKGRAAGALRHADYKAQPQVRARRIKTLEAEQRKQQRNIDEAEKFLAAWNRENLTHEQAKHISNYCHVSHCFTLAEYPRELPKTQYEGDKSLYSALDDEIIDVAQARGLAVHALTKRLNWSTRWLAHYTNRIGYEHAMLGEQGGLAADKFDIQVGGQVLVRGEWATVKRVNKRDGKITSVTTNARYVPLRPVEEIADYRAPSAEVAAAVKAATKLAPLANYPGEGFGAITKAEWDGIPKDYKTTKPRDATDTTGAHRVRVALGSFVLKGEKDMNKRHGYHAVFITDAKRTDPPAASAAPAEAAEAIPAAHRDISNARAVHQPREQTEFDAIRDQLRHGVQVVSAPQLFPTPPELAGRMVEMAGMAEGMTLLEPSAGTGAILAAVREATGGSVTRTAIEISAQLCDHLRIKEAGAEIYNRDFLECGDELGTFDVILMNPPFANGQDIAHILHAKKFLKPGGVLIAICANGPRQNATLRPMIEQNRGTWESLPSGTFQQSGTMVSSVLMRYKYHQ